MNGPGLWRHLALPPLPRLLPLGDTAVTVEFGDAVDPAVHARVRAFAGRLAEAVDGGGLAGVLEWVPTFRSVTVHFDPERIDYAALTQRLLAIAGEGAAAVPAGRRWRIPVCFEGQFAPDLEDIAEAKGLAPQEIVRQLTGTVFSVYMLGFLPGFPYLGGLPEALAMPRLATPRPAVPERSIAVAGLSCAAYPWESPGGWRLVGRTPVRLFDPAEPARPALLAPGDEVTWQAVNLETYERMEACCARGRFDAASLLCAAGTA